MAVQTETLHVTGIRCERCVGRLALTLKDHPGLEQANATLMGQSHCPGTTSGRLGTTFSPRCRAGAFALQSRSSDLLARGPRCLRCGHQHRGRFFDLRVGFADLRPLRLRRLDSRSQRLLFRRSRRVPAVLSLRSLRCRALPRRKPVVLADCLLVDVAVELRRVEEDLLADRDAHLPLTVVDVRELPRQRMLRLPEQPVLDEQVVPDSPTTVPTLSSSIVTTS